MAAVRAAPQVGSVAAGEQPELFAGRDWSADLRGASQRGRSPLLPARYHPSGMRSSSSPLPPPRWCVPETTVRRRCDRPNRPQHRMACTRFTSPCRPTSGTPGPTCSGTRCRTPSTARRPRTPACEPLCRVTTCATWAPTGARLIAAASCVRLSVRRVPPLWRSCAVWRGWSCAG